MRGQGDRERRAKFRALGDGHLWEEVGVEKIKRQRKRSSQTGGRKPRIQQKPKTGAEDVIERVSAWRGRGWRSGGGCQREARVLPAAERRPACKRPGVSAREEAEVTSLRDSFKKLGG